MGYKRDDSVSVRCDILLRDLWDTWFEVDWDNSAISIGWM